MKGCFSFLRWRRRMRWGSSLHCARVVHVSGFVEDFYEPVRVREVVGEAKGKKPPAYFLCTAAHLLSFGTQPLSPDQVLQVGGLYFLIPHSIFHTDSSSPTDLVSLAARLTAVANRTPDRRSSSSTSRRRSSGSGSSSPANESSNRLFSPSPTRVLPVSSCRGSPWKPGLETIGEKSFDRR